MKIACSILLVLLLTGCPTGIEEQPTNAGSPDIFYTYINLDESLQPLVFEDIHNSKAKSDAIAYSEFQSLEFEASGVNLSSVETQIQTTGIFESLHSQEISPRFIGQNYDQTIIALEYGKLKRIYDNYPNPQPGKGWLRVLNCDSLLENLIVVVNNIDTIYTDLEYIQEMSISSHDFLLADAGTLNFKFINKNTNETLSLFPSIGLNERDKATVYIYRHSVFGTRSKIILE